MSKPAPIWPNNQKIPVIGFAGEFSSGKTVAIVTIDPENTKYFDFELSGASYEGLGFERVDMPSVMTRCAGHIYQPEESSGCQTCAAVQAKGYKPIDVFVRWWQMVRSIRVGKYSVIGADPIGTIETGLADYVRANPREFGRTADVYTKMVGVFWQDVKSLQELILADLASRCQTFAFSTHMKYEWTGHTPNKNKREPKGKETLWQLASLYLQLERPIVQGKQKAIPAAQLLKTRISTITKDKKIVPILPPFMAEYTADTIREYIKKPPNYKSLKKSETVPEPPPMSDEEKLRIEKEIAQAKRDSDEASLQREQLRLDAVKRQSEEFARRRAAEQKKQAGEVLVPADRSSKEQKKTDAKIDAARSAVADNGQPNDLEIAKMESLRVELGVPDDKWPSILERAGADSVAKLSRLQFDDLMAKLEARAAAKN